MNGKRIWIPLLLLLLDLTFSNAIRIDKMIIDKIKLPGFHETRRSMEAVLAVYTTSEEENTNNAAAPKYYYRANENENENESVNETNLRGSPRNITVTEQYPMSESAKGHPLLISPSICNNLTNTRCGSSNDLELHPHGNN